MMRWLSVVLLSWFGAAAAGQTCVYSAASGSLAPPTFLVNTPGVGYTERTQILYPAILFQNVPTLITDISVMIPFGWRRTSSAELTVRMGHTAVSQLSGVYAQNITSPLVDVLVARNHVWLQGIGPTWVPLGLQRAFQYLPGSGNLLIEIVARDTVLLEQTPPFNLGFEFAPYGQILGNWDTTLPSSGGLQGWAPRMSFCVDRAETMLLGQSCNGSSASTPLLGVTGRPTPGASPTLWLSDAPANAVAACAYGFDTAPPFPVDLTSLGAPGCRQYFPVAFADVVVADSLGVGQRAIAVPNAASTMGAILYAQYWVFDPPANQLDLTTSNYARLLVGL